MTPFAALPDAREPLEPEAARSAFDAIMEGWASDEEIARLLVQMADRGETVDEVVAAARALRARMLPVEAPEGAIDVCGTGGDAAGTLNVSTAVAIVVAACGVPVAKHGNRAASSRSGAADVLRALGLEIEQPPAAAERSLAELGIAFLFAANHHPAVARVAPVRRALGRRTIFNLLGPLANPAEVKRQLLGVYAPQWAEPLARSLHALGAERAIVVHGSDGIDELTVAGPSLAVHMDGGAIRTDTVEPAQAGVGVHAPGAVTGGDPHENAAAITRLLAGAPGPYRDVVLLNAAGALIVAGRAEGWRDGAALAAQAIDSGAAADLLARWIAFR